MCKKEMVGGPVSVHWIDDNGEYNLHLHGDCWNKMTTLFRAWQKLQKENPYSWWEFKKRRAQIVEAAKTVDFVK